MSSPDSASPAPNTTTPPTPNMNGLSKLNPANILSTTSPSHPPSSTTSTSTSPSTPPPTTICVFCGASPGTSPAHLAAARALAHTFHAHNIHLVYGGGTVGLMGEVARTLVSLSGPSSVHGIIPSPLVQFERGPESTSAAGTMPKVYLYGHTTVVKDMHTRKQLMAQEVLAGGPGSGFVALSGGYGTLEELMEVVTWNQLGIHDRGVCVLNVEGYWDGLLEWVRGAVGAGFVSEGSKGIIAEGRDGEECVRKLREYVTPKGKFKLDWGAQ